MKTIELNNYNIQYKYLWLIHFFKYGFCISENFLKYFDMHIDKISFWTINLLSTSDSP